METSTTQAEEGAGEDHWGIETARLDFFRVRNAEFQCLCRQCEWRARHRLDFLAAVCPKFSTPTSAVRAPFALHQARKCIHSTG
jgi:hypothetical protein